MTIPSILSWLAGISSLLYFGAAMLHPAWFLGEEAESTTTEDVHQATPSVTPIEEMEGWQYIG